MSLREKLAKINTVLDDPEEDVLPAGGFGDDDAMLQQQKHIVRKAFAKDIAKGTTTYEAVVLSKPAETVTQGLLDSAKQYFKDKLRLPQKVFTFHAMIPPYTDALPNPCNAIESIKEVRQLPDDFTGLTKKEADSVRRIIFSYPEIEAVTSVGSEGTTLPIPGVGDTVRVTFAKGPAGGRLRGGAYVELLSKNGFSGIANSCGLTTGGDLVELFDVVTQGGGEEDPYGEYDPPQTGTYIGKFSPSPVAVTNGDIPSNLLGKTKTGIIILKDIINTPVKDGGADWEGLVVAFNKKFPERNFPGPNCSGIRSYQGQVNARKNMESGEGAPAAYPGTSKHGWGMAIDIDTKASFGKRATKDKEGKYTEAFNSPEYKWLLENAPTYGWMHPAFAQAGGSAPEPWHWEPMNQEKYIKKD